MHEAGYEKADAVGQSFAAPPDEDVDAMGVASGQASLSPPSVTRSSLDVLVDCPPKDVVFVN